MNGKKGGRLCTKTKVHVSSLPAPSSKMTNLFKPGPSNASTNADRRPCRLRLAGPPPKKAMKNKNMSLPDLHKCLQQTV